MGPGGNGRGTNRFVIASQSFNSFKKAREYFIEQGLEYEEAVTVFIYLPALLQFHSAKLLGLSGYLGGPRIKDKSMIDQLDLALEIDRIIEIFEEYDDQVRAKMARFFLLSYKISMMNKNQEYSRSINEIGDIYQWMVDKGEIHYSEMIGQFLDLIKQYR